jgi:thiamine kinase-like enzyme
MPRGDAGGGGRAVHLTPDEAIARIDEWRGKEVDCREIGGGITNHNYLVTVDEGRGGAYVLRIPGAGTDAFIDRDRELGNHVSAAQAGVSPPLLHVLEPEKCTVVPFIDGETMHPDTLAGHPDRLEKVVDVIRTYHDKATFTNDTSVFPMIRDYLRMAKDVDAWFPPDWPWIMAVGEEIEQAMGRDEPRPVACHNDLLSENFILDGHGKMWLIDWEYGGVSDPYFDLGDFCVEHPLSRDEERLILTRYCGGMQEHRFHRMLLHKIVADLWWSIWAFIQERVSKLDFDYRAYGTARLDRLRANAADPQYSTWIATV